MSVRTGFLIRTFQCSEHGELFDVPISEYRVVSGMRALCLPDEFTLCFTTPYPMYTQIVSSLSGLPPQIIDNNKKTKMMFHVVSCGLLIALN